nr:glycosyltransferase [Helicobacter sp. 11S02596-1]
MVNFRLEVLKSLQNLGFTIHIIAPQDEFSDKLINEGFFFHPITLDPKGLNPAKDLATFFQIKKILASIKPTMSFHYTIKPVIYASIACASLKIPTINIITGLGYVFTDSTSKNLKETLKKKILKIWVSKMYQTALKHAQEVWFLNPDDQTEFINRNIITPSKAFLLKSEGVDLEHFSPDFSPDFLPRSVVAPSEKTIFLLVARMLWDKGVGEFVEVARKLASPHLPPNAPR